MAKSSPKVKRKTPAKTPARTAAPRKRAQPHGGELLSGNPGNVGGGRPKEEIREKLRKLGTEKGIPFLDRVLDGKVEIRLTEVCAFCGKEAEPRNGQELKVLMDDIRASVDQRMKAVEQTWKYGLGTKDEVDFAEHPEYQRRIAALRQALIEALGEDGALRVVMRADALVAGR